MAKGGVKGGQGFQRGGRVKDFKGSSMVSRGSKVPEGDTNFDQPCPTLSNLDEP